MTPKEELAKIVKELNPKSFARYLVNRPYLTTYLNDAYPDTSNVGEQFYLFANNTQVPTCINGRNRVFNSFTKGYFLYCAESKTCGCRSSGQSAKLADFWANNPDTKKQMLATKETTCLEKYGVKNHMQNADVVQAIGDKFEERYGTRSNTGRVEVREKITATNLERYGVEMPLMSNEIRQKATDTFVERHGPDTMRLAREAFAEQNDGLNPFQVYKERIREYWETRGLASHSQSHIPTDTLEILNCREKFAEATKNKTMYELVKRFNVSESALYRRLDLYDLRGNLSSVPKSAMEIELQGILEELGIEYIRGCRSIIAPQEIDFYFPTIKVGIELNGLYWHSDKFKKDSFHYEKWERSKAAGIELWQFWEDEWSLKKDIIVNKIIHAIGLEKPVVGARKIKIKRLGHKSGERELLQENHIQGPVSSRTAAYGGYYKEKLVGVLLCSMQKNESLEVVRYATNGENSYAGLFSKLLNFAVTDLCFTGTVFTFSDNNHSAGNLYAASGFSKIGEVAPSYYVTDGKIRFRREKFMKNKIKINHPEVYSPDLTEREMVCKLGFFRVWDSGKIKWAKQV